MYERTVSDSLGAQIRTRLGDAVEFAFLAVTLVAIGWLHFELVARLW